MLNRNWYEVFFFAAGINLGKTAGINLGKTAGLDLFGVSGLVQGELLLLLIGLGCLRLHCWVNKLFTCETFVANDMVESFKICSKIVFLCGHCFRVNA